MQSEIEERWREKERQEKDRYGGRNGERQKSERWRDIPTDGQMEMEAESERKTEIEEEMESEREE